MSKGKAVWLTADALKQLDVLKVIPEQTYDSVIKMLIAQLKMETKK